MVTSGGTSGDPGSLNSASIWDTGDCDDIKVHYVPRQFRPCSDAPSCSEKDDVIMVTAVGDSFMYIIPSFDVFSIELRPVKIKGYSIRRKETLTYDLFIRSHSSLDREYPSKLTIKDVTIIKEDEFNIIRDTSTLHLPPQGVMVIMKWEWHDELPHDAQHYDPDEIDHVSETSSEDLAALNPGIDSDVTDDDITDDGLEDNVTHTVTFKCIGVTCNQQYEKVLEKKWTTQRTAKQLLLDAI
ncbi:uncharacterized protein [Dysidea avara]|uniref:uncharacterized protein isoform X2 n=1 Tax=Dysidea avara TaxID=196820 RepID=UPI0033318216